MSFFFKFVRAGQQKWNRSDGDVEGREGWGIEGFAKLLVTTVLILFVYITRSYTPDAVPNIVYLHILYCLGESVVW